MAQYLSVGIIWGNYRATCPCIRFLCWVFAQSKQKDENTPPFRSHSNCRQTSVELLPVNLTPSKSLTSFSDAVSTKDVYEQIFVGDYIPSDSHEKYRCIQDLRRGLRRPCVLCTCSVGGPVGNYLFIWPIQDHVTLEAGLNENQKIISQIQSDVPVYHRRTLRKKLISKFGRISPKTS